MRFLLVTAVSLIVTSASANDLPRYDPDGWCKRVAEIGGGKSEMIRRGCFEQEQSAYDKLKPLWAGIPAKTRRWCDQVARAGGRGSYAALEQCLDMEHFSKTKNDNSKFRF
jgi:hypothetical protein